MRELVLFFALLAFIWCDVCFAARSRAYDLERVRDDSREAHLKTLPPEERELTEKLMADFKEVNIKASDGIILKAIVYDPKPTSSNGKNPLVVFISSWGVNKWEYVIPAHEMADRGYTVISYTARGFWGSGGEINLAGPLDMADVTSVLDWSLANTYADEEHIGLSGISYGGGMSILATAHDTRVRTATSMSCWTDLGQSMLGNGETIRKEAVRMLQLLAVLFGNVGDDLALLFEDYFANFDLPYMYEFTKNSSAMTFIDIINTRKPNIFIANAFQDSLFTPNQFPVFYNALKGNKHIEFAPGDHAGPELPGLLGIPDAVWSRAYTWMDYYIRDGHEDQMNSSIMPMVVYNTMYTDHEEVEGYASLEAVTTNYVQFALDKNENLSPINSNKEEVIRGGGESVVASITTGQDANINGGVAFVTATVHAYSNNPTHFDLTKIHKKYGAIFQTSSHSTSFAYSMRFRGIGKLTLHYIPKLASTGTFIVYLLDVESSSLLKEEGKLITFTPWTFKNAIVGQSNTLEIELTTFAYDFPAHHILAMVIATKDPLFLDQTPENEEIEILSGSILSLPVHN